MKRSVASVTFRSKTIREMVELAGKAKLDAIEWGGDIHVPPENRQAAHLALSLTREHGLSVSAYGSYYHAEQGEDFGSVLEAAMLLEAPFIRVWAGTQASAACSALYRGEVTARLATAVELAEAAGRTVVTEYHANTLTDSLESTVTLLDDVPGLRTLWQPPIGLSKEENLHALRILGNRIENLHVYHRDKEGNCRPLAEGASAWRSYFASVLSREQERYATLEFVMNDSEEQFLRDASVLRALLTEGQTMKESR